MKIILIALILFLPKVYATSCAQVVCKPGELWTAGDTSGSVAGCPKCVTSCPSGSFAVLSPSQGPICKAAFPSNIQDCYQCQMYYLQQQQQRANPYYGMTLPWLNMDSRYNSQVPWWATQGNYQYPNFQYPGAWYNHGIDTSYYRGNGGGVALKPNIYVKNEKIKLTKFSWKFSEKEKAEFLATTPALTNFGWEGLVSGESFRVKNVGYSYLFYDARMDHNKMQFDHGICVEKADLVTSMIGDLQKKSFPEMALKDFHEHWSEKIPNYPYYCVYPQYTEQMNTLMPVEVTPSDAQITRVLYVVIPHMDSPKVIAGKFPSLPSRAPASLMPALPKIQEKKIHFLEWGVAFLDGNLTK